MPSFKVYQAYRNAFSMFMDGFATYRPILSSIQAEYDRLVATLQVLDV